MKRDKFPCCTSCGRTDDSACAACVEGINYKAPAESEARLDGPSMITDPVCEACEGLVDGHGTVLCKGCLTGDGKHHKHWQQKGGDNFVAMPQEGDTSRERLLKALNDRLKVSCEAHKEANAEARNALFELLEALEALDPPTAEGNELLRAVMSRAVVPAMAKAKDVLAFAMFRGDPVMVLPDGPEGEFLDYCRGGEFCVVLTCGGSELVATEIANVARVYTAGRAPDVTDMKLDGERKKEES